MLSKEPEKIELGPEKARRTYWLKRPVLHERAKWRRAVAAAGGRLYGQVGLLDLMAAGIRSVMADSPPEIVDALLAKVAAQRANVVALGESSHDTDNPEDEEWTTLLDACRVGATGLSVIEHELMAAYEPYAIAVGDNAAYWQIAGIEAARAFCVGWEGLNEKHKRGPGGLTEDCLAVIPEEDFTALARFAEGLARVSEPERKNSNSPPHTSSGGETSTSLNEATSGPSPNSASSVRPGQSLN
jgi:hypothetical protein